MGAHDLLEFGLGDRAKNFHGLSQRLRTLRVIEACGGSAKLAKDDGLSRINVAGRQSYVKYTIANKGAIVYLTYSPEAPSSWQMKPAP